MARDPSLFQPLHGSNGTYRPKGGWCKGCIKRVVDFDCGGMGAMKVGRQVSGGVVHVFMYDNYFSICGKARLRAS